jgi:Tfp pilus assembly protein PilW
LPELLVSTLLSGGILFGMSSMMITSLRTADKTRAAVSADQGAGMTMQLIVTDVREAKNVTILDGGRRLRLLRPIMDARGYYNRFEPDLDHQVDYYLSDESGIVGRSGTRLWQAQADGTVKTRLRKDVFSLNFEQETSRSVRITIVTQGIASVGTQKTTLSQRVVYMRNY